MTLEENERIERIKNAFKMACEDMKYLTPELQRYAVSESIKDLIKDKTEQEVLREYGYAPYFTLKFIDLLTGPDAQSLYETINAFINTKE